MRQTVGQQDFHTRQLWRVPRESVAHLNGRIQFRRALLQNIGEILARMLPAGKVQRDPPLPPDRYDAAGERSRASVVRCCAPASESACPCRRCASHCPAPPAGSTRPARVRANFAAASINSHCVAAGNGIPSCSSSRSIRLKGIPVPYFSSAIIATAVASYFSGPDACGFARGEHLASRHCSADAPSRTRSPSAAPAPRCGSASSALSAGTLFPRGIPGKDRPVCSCACCYADLFRPGKRSWPRCARARPAPDCSGSGVSVAAEDESLWFQHGVGLLRVPPPHQSFHHRMHRGFELLAVRLAQRPAWRHR